MEHALQNSGQAFPLCIRPQPLKVAGQLRSPCVHFAAQGPVVAACGEARDKYQVWRCPKLSLEAVFVHVHRKRRGWMTLHVQSLGLSLAIDTM